MTARFGRSSSYRYLVPLESAELTPLSHIEVFYGPMNFRVLNVSQGGVALLLSSDPVVKVGDIINASVSIRERAFPVQLEIKSIQGFRVGTEFVAPSEIFLAALKEFFQPKTLGATLAKQENFSNVESLKNKIPNAQIFEVYQSNNLSFLAFWLSDDRRILGALGVANDLVFCWSPQQMFQSGRMRKPLEHAFDFVEFAFNATYSSGKIESEFIAWDRAVEPTVQHYFADIFLSWLKIDEGKDFVEMLTSKVPLGPDRTFRLPK